MLLLRKVQLIINYRRKIFNFFSDCKYSSDIFKRGFSASQFYLLSLPGVKLKYFLWTKQIIGVRVRKIKCWLYWTALQAWLQAVVYLFLNTHSLLWFWSFVCSFTIWWINLNKYVATWISRLTCSEPSIKCCNIFPLFTKLHAV